MMVKLSWGKSDRILLVVLLALSLAFVNIAPSASASDAPENGGSSTRSSSVDFSLEAGRCSAKLLAEDSSYERPPADADYISVAESQGYVTQSGQAQSFSRATVTHLDGMTVVAVPISSPHKDLDPVNHVSYVFRDGKLTDIIELKSSYSVGYFNAEYTLWSNGKQIASGDVSYWGYLRDRASKSFDNNYSPSGISWKDLNRCLNNQGISWVAISIAVSVCSVACTALPFTCAYCLAIGLGTNTGVLLSCVEWAWK